MYGVPSLKAFAKRKGVTYRFIDHYDSMSRARLAAQSYHAVGQKAIVIRGKHVDGTMAFALYLGQKD